MSMASLRRRRSTARASSAAPCVGVSGDGVLALLIAAPSETAFFTAVQFFRPGDGVLPAMEWRRALVGVDDPLPLVWTVVGGGSRLLLRPRGILRGVEFSRRAEEGDDSSSFFTTA